MKQCRYCKQDISPEHQAKREEERKEKIRKAIELRVKMGIHTGRPRKVDYDKIYKIRDKGFSINKTAELADVSRGSVQNALKVRKKNEQSRKQ